MKKFIKPISLGLGAFAILGMAFNVWAYRTFQQWMIMRLPDLPPQLEALSVVVAVAILLAAFFHLAILFHTLFFIPRMEKNFFWGAFYFSLLILSGILLVSDGALLSDIGKEYIQWEVTQEWNMLYAFSSLQLMTMMVGWILLASSKEKVPFAIFPKAEKFDETIYIITAQVGLICGILGLFMLPSPYYFEVLERYRSNYIMILSLLALVPFISSIIYWLLRNRGKHLQQLMDEKQFQDISLGTVFAILILTILLFLGMILSNIGVIDLNNPIFGFLAIDSIIIAISSTVLIRTRL